MTEYRLVDDIDWQTLHGKVAQFEVSDNYVTIVLLREPGKPLVKLCVRKHSGHTKKGVSPNGTPSSPTALSEPIVPDIVHERTPGA
jgi:hypothetical protein